jgi:hypothetical protein
MLFVKPKEGKLKQLVVAEMRTQDELFDKAAEICSFKTDLNDVK